MPPKKRKRKPVEQPTIPVSSIEVPGEMDDEFVSLEELALIMTTHSQAETLFLKKQREGRQ
jgi:hypothetical protein